MSAEETFNAWLDAHAESLDTDQSGDAVLPALAQTQFLRVGVAREWGGSGGDVRDAIVAIAAVAERSLTTAFVLWGHRTFIEYLLQSPNEVLRKRLLQKLLDGEVAGATGLSNAMKFLSGIESLQIEAKKENRGWSLNGRMPWVTNLRPAAFVVAGVVTNRDGPPLVVALPHDREGLQRSADLDLIAMRGSNTAAIEIKNLRIDEADLLHPDAGYFLPRVRPAFLGLQCGMSIGLARASLDAADVLCKGPRHILRARIDAARTGLADATDALYGGVIGEAFVRQPGALFRLRIQLAELAQEAVNLELQAAGGRAYLTGQQPGFARRWRETAFIPLITPSLTQLQGELLKQAVASHAA